MPNPEEPFAPAERRTDRQREGFDPDAAPYGDETLPQGEDVRSFGAPHDYAYAPSEEERRPDYLASSDEPQGDERPEPVQRASGGQANADMAANAAPGERGPGEDMEVRQDQLLDEAIEETFPASDPISPKRIT
jgi:hypothetical protein